MHKILTKFEFWPDRTTESPLFSVAFHPILFILASIVASNEDMHKILNEIEFWPDRTTDYGVSFPRESKKFPIDL